MTTHREELSKIQADMATLTNADPYKEGTVLYALLNAVAGRSVEHYTNLDFMIAQAFVELGTSANVRRNQAKAASGKLIVQTASEAGTIALTDTFTVDTLVYGVGVAAPITTLSESNLQIEIVSGSRGRVLFPNGHQYVTGQTFTISGTTGWNGNYTAIVSNAQEILFAKTTASLVAEKGTITTSFAAVSVTCTSQGYVTNKVLNVEMVYNGDLDDVTLSLVSPAGLQGGEDVETLTHFKDRLRQFFTEPQAPFSIYNIEQNILNASSNIDRVGVQEANGTDVNIRIAGAGDNISLGSYEVQQAKKAIEGLIPAPLDINSTNITVASSSPRPVAIEISGLTPGQGDNLQDLQNTVRDNLKDYFLSLKPYDNLLRSALIHVITGSGESLVSADHVGGNFTLIQPNADIRGTGQTFTIDRITFS